MSWKWDSCKNSQYHRVMTSDLLACLMECLLPSSVWSQNQLHNFNHGKFHPSAQNLSPHKNVGVQQLCIPGGKTALLSNLNRFSQFRCTEGFLKACSCFVLEAHFSVTHCHGLCWAPVKLRADKVGQHVTKITFTYKVTGSAMKSFALCHTG